MNTPIRVTQLLLAAAALACVDPALAIYRCEDSRGRTVYSELPCPADMKTVRRVDESPAIRVLDEKAAGEKPVAEKPVEKPAEKPAAEKAGDKAVEKLTVKPTPETNGKPAAAAQATSDSISATRGAAARFDPVQEDRRLNAQLNTQRRDCEQRARRIQFLQEDVRAATGSSRSSAELALRRAQDEYTQLCPRSR
jgi:Domain of unknown function (DUF4124)